MITEGEPILPLLQRHRALVIPEYSQYTASCNKAAGRLTSCITGNLAS
jgi:hypothetical protein